MHIRVRNPEALTQAGSSFQGAEFVGLRGVSQKSRLGEWGRGRGLLLLHGFFAAAH